MYPDWTKID